MIYNYITFHPCVNLWVWCVFHRVLWTGGITIYLFLSCLCIYQDQPLHDSNLFFTINGLSWGRLLYHICFKYIGIHILKLRTWELLFLIVSHFSLSIHCPPSPPLFKGTPNKGCHWRSKMVTILIINQFEFFNLQLDLGNFLVGH